MKELTHMCNVIGWADLKVGDELLVDGGMVQFEVVEKIGPDVKCLCTDSGLLLPRATLTFWRGGSIVREKNVMLPTISSKVFLLSTLSCPSLPYSACGSEVAATYSQSIIRAFNHILLE
jgi:hypothetical protein